MAKMEINPRQLGNNFLFLTFAFCPLIFGSSPNQLSSRGPRGDKCSVISGARKESPLACNHKARIPLRFRRGCPSILRSYFFWPPLRFAENRTGGYGKGISRRCLRRNRPFLLVESSLRPGPCRDCIQILIN